MYCPKCGSYNKDDLQYCVECGALLTATGAQGNGQESTATQNPGAQQPYNVIQKQAGRTNIPLIIASCVAVAAVTALVVVLIMRPSSTPASVGATPAQTAAGGTTGNGKSSESASVRVSDSNSSEAKKSSDTDNDQVSASSSEQSAASSSATVTKTPAATSAPAATAEPSQANSFPRLWSGTYTGTSSYVHTDDHHITRAVGFQFTSVSEAGDLDGICYVGTETAGPGATYGTCYISGHVNWSTGEIYLVGTSWIDHGGLGDLREYSGNVNFQSQSMSGTAWDVGTGLYETPWQLHSTSQISILQENNWVTIS